jgi:hypothetical protein
MERKLSHSTKITRRSFTAGAAATATFVAAPSILRAQGAALKVGVLLPRSGFQASIGQDCQRGVDVAAGILKQLGLPGLQIMNADTETNVEVARARAEKLISDGAQLLVGAFDSGQSSAIAQVAEQKGIPFVINIAAAPPITEQGFAGLGVGGIALALAAQKTLENLFGGISIIMREAIRVGDVCNIAGQIGMIEDIGIGATRLRAVDRRVVSVPNAQIYQMNLENLSMRDKFLFKHILALRRDTSPEQMRYVLSTINETLRNHPKIEVETARILFIEFGSSSLDTEIFAYVKETDYVCFLRVQQELLLSILDIVSASGTALALPSQTTYLERDTRFTSDAVEHLVAQRTGRQISGEGPRRTQDADSSSRTATPEVPTES